MRLVLPVIVIAQFMCTSVWFAGNAIITDIIAQQAVPDRFLAHLTSAIQFGFISGTLLFAVLAISDRFSPSMVFFISSLLAAAFNLGMVLTMQNPTALLLLRSLTGFCLAGIYPVGMKIASDYYKDGLGKSLGFLVGALVLGTALPHLIKSFTLHLPWRTVIYATSLLSALGGTTLVWLVPDGPFRKKSYKPDMAAFLKGFRNSGFQSASFGYFGHMWELYTFWAFVPVMLAAYKDAHESADLNISLLSFIIIGAGTLACILSGIWSRTAGTRRLATIALLLSCLCCLLSPHFLFHSSIIVFMAFLLFWGLVVIADSPLFSTLVAKNAPEEYRGASLTIVNCIGFSITILSIQCISFMAQHMSHKYLYTFLAFGPIIGLFSLIKGKTEKRIGTTKH